MNIDNVRRKIRGLLAMAAEGSGAMPEERATAQLLADKLTAEYGLDKLQARKPPQFEPPLGPKPDVMPGQFVVVVNGQYYVVDRGAFGFQFNGRSNTTSGGWGNGW